MTRSAMEDGWRAMVLAGVALAAALSLVGCTTSAPIVASGRATAGELMASLRQAGLCNDDPPFSAPQFQMMDEMFAYCQQDELVVTFFQPSESGTITVLFPPVQCSVDVEDEPMVWGLNWTIIARPGAAPDALERAASATDGTLTSTRSALATFCEAFFGD